MYPLPLVVVRACRPPTEGITTICTRGNKQKTPPLGASAEGGYPWGVGALAAEGRHHLASEPGELLGEFSERQALGEMDHVVLEARVARLDRLDPLDHVGGRAAEPRLLLDAVAQEGRPRGRPGRAPGAAVLVGVAHESERGEPLVALVVGGLHAARRLCRRVGQVEPGAPDDVLAELFGMAVAQTGRVVLAHDVVEDLLAVEGDH